MFDSADQALFFDAALPGYALSTINGAPVDSLFRGPYAEVFGSVSGYQPSILISADNAAATAAAKGMTVAVRAISYVVASIESDQTTGNVRLLLEKQ